MPSVPTDKVGFLVPGNAFPRSESDGDRGVAGRAGHHRARTTLQRAQGHGRRMAR